MAFIVRVILSPLTFAIFLLNLLARGLKLVRKTVDGCIESVVNVTSLLWSTKDVLEDQAKVWMENYREGSFSLEEAQAEFATKKRTGKFANYVGKRAYFQFGVRARNGANTKVTRKWIRNFIDESCPSLRIQDKINVIDEALFLSFIPSGMYNDCEELASTIVYEDELPFGDSSS
jgi:hypothetical protein